jgi:two-component system, cell cycle response regulator
LLLTYRRSTAQTYIISFIKLKITMTQAASKVLVVDESRIVRASVAKRVTEQFMVREEADGDAAWHALLTDRNVVAVITDLKTPGLSGYDLIKRIRASKVPRVRRLPVIALTGDDERAERQAASKAGASDFLPKNMRAVDALMRLDALIELAQKNQIDLPDAPLQIKDHDTGLSTRTYLVMQMEQMAANAKRSRMSCALLLVNAGVQYPQCAQFLSANLASMVRTGDVAAQINATTFAIVSMPHSLESTQGLVNRIIITTESVLGKHPDLLLFAITEVTEDHAPDAAINQALLSLAPWDKKRFVTSAQELALPSLDELLARIKSGDLQGLESMRPALRAYAEPLLNWLGAAQ